MASEVVVKLSVKFPIWLKPYLWLMKTAHQMGFAVSGDAVVDNVMASTKFLIDGNAYKP